MRSQNTPHPPTIGSLFSGIGGLELGLEMGLGSAHTLWQAEIDPFARAVLKKHWPDAIQMEDVRDVSSTNLAAVDIICGGFPCQPHSLAGRRQSSNDERDLWGEFARVVGDLRPRWVVAENVPGLRSSKDPAHGRDHKGGFFGRVLRDLAEIGFDAEWHSYAAADVGAHHKRERVFIVAYSNGEREPQPRRGQPQEWEWVGDGGPSVADTQGVGPQTLRLTQGEGEKGPRPARSREAPGVMADTDSSRGRALAEGWHEPHGDDPGRQEAAGGFAACGSRLDRDGSGGGLSSRDLPEWAGGEWEQPSPITRSPVRGMAHGLPARVDRLKTLGNAVSPQQAAVIGRAIRDAELHLRLTGAFPDRIVQPRHFR